MLEPSYGPRNTEADRPTYDLEVTDGSERQIAGSFSSGGCCENGVDGYALIALLAGKISFLDNAANYTKSLINTSLISTVLEITTFFKMAFLD